MSNELNLSDEALAELVSNWTQNGSLLRTVPVSTSAQTFFRTDAPEPRQPNIVPPADGDRNTCRWCLERFDVTQQGRSTPERGYLRTNLKMSDSGSELVCCDQCWQGAIGARTLMMGRVVPSDPNVVDNPLLRALVANP